MSIAKMREQLLEGFPEPQADLMTRVFVSAHDELVTKAELNELTAVVRELAEIQGRTDEKLGSLAEAQRRTEWAVKALAKQVGGLSAAAWKTLSATWCPSCLKNTGRWWWNRPARKT